MKNIPKINIITGIFVLFLAIYSALNITENKDWIIVILAIVTGISYLFEKEPWLSIKKIK